LSGGVGPHPLAAVVDDGLLPRKHKPDISRICIDAEDHFDRIVSTATVAAQALRGRDRHPASRDQTFFYPLCSNSRSASAEMRTSATRLQPPPD